MTQYQVGFYFQGGDGYDVKSARMFANYEDAVDEYLDRLKAEFHKLGRISTTLGIGYIENGELTYIERLILDKN
jgi:hypothetical protein